MQAKRELVQSGRLELAKALNLPVEILEAARRRHAFAKRVAHFNWYCWDVVGVFEPGLNKLIEIIRYLARICFIDKQGYKLGIEFASAPRQFLA